MSDAVNTMKRLQTVQDASADFLLRWVAESMMNETLCSDKLWGDICSSAPEAESTPGFLKYHGRLDD
jgi:hypothetical protein